MPTADSSDFVVGETAVLYVNVSSPRTRAGVDPTTMTLTGLWRGSTPVALPDAVTFTRVETGLWTLLLDTTDYLPGIYTWRAAAVGSAGLSVVEDTLALRAAGAI